MFWFEDENVSTVAALSRLLDKQLIRAAIVTNDGKQGFRWTPIGKAVASNMEKHLPTVALGRKNDSVSAVSAPALPTASEPANPEDKTSPPHADV